jgi:hypothetical protein
MGVTTNPLLTGLPSGDSIEILDRGTGVSHTGDTNEATLGTALISGDVPNVGDEIWVLASYKIDDGAGGAPAGTMTSRVEFDTVSGCSVSTISRGIYVMKPFTVENSTMLSSIGVSYYRPEKASSWVELTVDISAGFTIDFTVQLTNAADTAYLLRYSVLLIKAS